MLFYTTSTFRLTFASLIKKNKDGYSSVGTDICNALMNMPDNILRETNDRIRHFAEYRVVKLRLPNSGQHLPKNNGFRLIYWVSVNESMADSLHQVDIANGLAELSQHACLPGDK